MPDYQQTVEEIRFALQSQECELTDELRSAATEYTRALKEVNSRLRRCGDYLRRGLRSEAIQLAESEPNLLEAIATLDFPERDDWAEIVAIYELPRPEPLLLDVAQELNEAYVIEQPLQKLLARHRLLALARAPLKQRLKVLRRLADMDPESTHWEEDVREYERARMGEIESDAHEAARRADAGRLQGLTDELGESEWREPVPKSLAKRVREYAGVLGRRAARDELEPLVERLEAAFNELDLEATRPLCNQWEATAARAGLSADDPLLERVEPILGWVGDEDEREAADRACESAIAALDRALDGDASLKELDRRWHELAKLERDIPESLAARFESRVAALELAQRRTRRLQVGGAVGALAAVAAFIALIIQQQLQAQEVRQVADAVEELLDDGQIAEARELLQENTDLGSSEELLVLRKRLADAELAESERVSAWQSSVDDAESASDYNAAVRALERARSLAMLPEEKRDVATLENEWNRRHQEAMAQAEQRFQVLMGSTTADLTQANDLIEEDPATPEAEALLDSVAAQLTQLASQAATLRPELQSQVQLLAARHQQLIEHRASLLKRMSLENRLLELALIPTDVDDAQSAVTSYVQGLKDYVDALGDEGLIAEVESTTEEAPLWTGAVEWNRLSQQWGDPWPTSDVVRRLAACEVFLEQFGDCPERDEVAVYTDVLGALRNREDSDDGAAGEKTRLERRFSNWLIKDVWCVSTKDGTTYYVPDRVDFTRENQGVQIHSIVGFRETDVRNVGLLASDLKARVATPAPQTRLAQMVKDRLPKLGRDEWEPFLLELAQSILEDDELDSFLQFDLLKLTLESASAGSWFLREPLRRPIIILDGAGINPLVRWMDPEDKDARQARDQARNVLDELPELAQFWDAADVRREALLQQFREQSMMIGYLWREGGTWICRTRWQPDERYRLHVVYRDSGGGPSQWRQVGHADGETIALRPFGAEAFLSVGKPVFAVLEQPRGGSR